MSNSNAPIMLTPDQVIALVGHGATQEQLNDVRRELSDKIDRTDAKIDAKFNQILGFLLA